MRLEAASLPYGGSAPPPSHKRKLKAYLDGDRSIRAYIKADAPIPSQNPSSTAGLGDVEGKPSNLQLPRVPNGNSTDQSQKSSRNLCLNAEVVQDSLHVAARVLKKYCELSRGVTTKGEEPEVPIIIVPSDIPLRLRVQSLKLKAMKKSSEQKDQTC
jgi:hypothetical protein